MVFNGSANQERFPVNTFFLPVNKKAKMIHMIVQIL